MKTAILFGASGFIGSSLLDGLLQSPNYEQVIVVVRRKLNIVHPKLKVLIGDLNTLGELKAHLRGDDVYIALGTTRKKTPNLEEYYKIDHDYPVYAAKIAKENGCKSIFLVSAVGANANSSSFYLKIKGETERDILDLGFEYTHIFRPSMLLGDRVEKRPFEKFMIHLWGLIDSIFIGSMSIYRGIKGPDLAKAMIIAAQDKTLKESVYHWADMQRLITRA